MAKRSRNVRRNRKPAFARYPEPSLEVVRLQLNALTCHPDPAIHFEAEGLLQELRRCEADSCIIGLANLHAGLDHALKFAESPDRSLFLAAHSVVGRLYRAALWAAGPVPSADRL